MGQPLAEEGEHRGSEGPSGGLEHADLSPIRRHYVKDVLAVLRTVKTKQEMQEKLCPFVGKLSPRDATVIFKMMYNRQVSVDFYKWVKSQEGFEPHFHLYVAFAHCLMRVQKWVALERLVEEMLENSFPPDIKFYAQVIREAINVGRFQTAENWFVKMRSQGCSPDVIVYNILILEYGKRGHFSEAMKYFGQLKEEGLVPDGGTYCAALSACRKAGDLERGADIIKEMKGAGIELDQVAYSILIDMFGKAGRYEDAAATFRELQVWFEIRCCVFTCNGVQMRADALSSAQRPVRRKVITLLFLGNGTVVEGSLSLGKMHVGVFVGICSFVCSGNCTGFTNVYVLLTMPQQSLCFCVYNGR